MHIHSTSKTFLPFCGLLREFIQKYPSSRGPPTYLFCVVIPFSKMRFEPAEIDRTVSTINLNVQFTVRKSPKEKSYNRFKMSLNFFKRFWQRKYSNHIVIAGVEWFRWHFSEIQINQSCTGSRTTRKPRTSRKFWKLR